ncbi:hypothetical protein [Burkholderia ubonensis]|uniref:Uncharacterized protein n=1 Tax=Burkholderia ubonensis subsp. mesacidophila TaxID=265293 RepID=A0A2A4FCG0_9BURK|nr:hypothetical protein [Burkholderia ubonensis]PCE30372.1 hypothetical protein BZL54_22020 [Burkholderia ubonensis subsp. mesacidophila]
MITEMQDEIVQFLRARGNGAYSKLQLHFHLQGRQQEFIAAFDALVEAGQIQISGGIVKLTAPALVQPDGDETAQ